MSATLSGINNRGWSARPRPVVGVAALAVANFATEGENGGAGLFAVTPRSRSSPLSAVRPRRAARDGAAERGPHRPGPGRAGAAHARRLLERPAAGARARRDRPWPGRPAQRRVRRRDRDRLAGLRGVARRLRDRLAGARRATGRRPAWAAPRAGRAGRRPTRPSQRAPALSTRTRSSAAPNSPTLASTDFKRRPPRFSARRRRRPGSARRGRRPGRASQLDLLDAVGHVVVRRGRVGPQDAGGHVVLDLGRRRRRRRRSRRWQSRAGRGR